MKKIIVAGGCFWGVEEYYKRIKGIIGTRVGYVNSKKENITYEEVRSQKFDAIEACEIFYDETTLTLDNILELLFRVIDPTSLDKQGEDIGKSYRVGAYYENEEDKEIIEKFVFAQEKNYDKEIVFEIKKMENFYEAEEYHQKYLVKNPSGYCHVDFSKIKPEELK